MSQPKISVIIPVYNTEKYLRECLDSVVNQTLEDIEIICVDDCSTDSSPDILREYAECDDRIKIITHEQNKKQAAVKKSGVALASGQYIWFVDSDDTIALDGCEKAFKLAEEKKVDIIHFGMEIINAGDLSSDRVNDAREYAKPFNGKLTNRDVFTGCFEKNLYSFTLVSKLFETNLCKKAFQYIEEISALIAEDEYIFWVISYFAKSYYGEPSLFLYAYNFGIGVSARNMVSLQMHKNLCEAIYAWDAMKRFLERWGEEKRYSKILKKIQYQLLRNCVFEWHNRCIYEDKAEEYIYMLKHWRPDEVVAEVAKLNWDNKRELATILKSCYKDKTPAKKVKRIGVYYHRMTVGGAEKVTLDLIRLWQSMGYECVLITDESPDKNDYPMPDNVKRIVIPSCFALTPQNYFERAKAWANSIQKYELDTIVYHCWVSPCLLWDMMLTKALDSSFIIHCHGIFSFLLTFLSTYWAEMPAIYSIADSVVTLSAADKHFWSQFNPKTYRVVNPRSIENSDGEISDLKKKTVVWSGRISGEKCPEDCVEIAAMVAKEIPNVKFYMVGDSEEDFTYLSRLKNQAKELGVSRNIVFTGFKSDVKPYYLDSSVFLLTSVYEGYCLSLAEAKSFGLPCVMYELPHLTLAENNRGIIPVKMRDTAAAARAIISLLKDYPRRCELGKASFEHMREINSFNFAEEWQKIFDGITEPPERKIDPAAEIMWNTLTEHYSVGVKNSEQEKYRMQLHINELRKGKNIVEYPPVTGDLTERDREIQLLRTEIAAIHSSWTYKLGSILTFIPRGFRRVKNCKREHSWGYTLGRVKARIPDLFKGWRF